MIAVVFYHSILARIAGEWGGNTSYVYTGRILPIISTWLMTLHTYAFVFASGYLFYMLRYEYGKYRSTKKDILHRASQLLLPYFVVSLLWVVPCKLLFFGGNIVRILVRDILLCVDPAQLWFLPMLFTLFLLFYFLSDLVNQLRPTFAFVFFLGIHYISAVFWERLPLGIFRVGNTLEYLLFYYLGFQYRKENAHLLERIPKLILMVFSIVLFEIYFQMRRHQSMMVATLLLKPFVCMTNVYFALLICLRYGNYVKRGKLYCICRDNSMGIYLLHQQFIYFVIRLLERYDIPSFVYVICCFFSSVFLPMIAFSLIKCCRFGRMIFG